MNYSMIIYILGYLLRFEAIFLILPTIVGFIYRETDAFVYLGLSLAIYLLGTLLPTNALRKNNFILRRDL